MKFEQESNPSAAVAAPPFNKGGKGLAPELAETAAANVPLAKGGWPAGPGGFCESRGNLVSNTIMPPFIEKFLGLKSPFASFVYFRGSIATSLQFIIQQQKAGFTRNNVLAKPAFFLSLTGLSDRAKRRAQSIPEPY